MLALLTSALHAQTTFATTTYPTGNGSRTPVTGDFNGDGKPDFATPVANSGEVQIYLNSGSGAFAFKSRVSVGTALQVATADINKDGKLDLVVATGDGGATVQTFLGAGDGTFVPGESIVLSKGSTDLELLDLNNDHVADFVIHDCDFAQPTAICDLVPFMNDGAGHFTAKPALIANSTTTASFGFRTIAVGDFNADGKNDVAFIRYGPSESGGRGFNVFFGHGDGTFGPPSFYATPLPVSIAAGSFSHDAYVDLDVATVAPCFGPPCQYYAAVYLNDHTGHFGLRSRTLIYGTAHSVTDVNGDGIEDIMGTSEGQEGGQYILGHGDGTFGGGQNVGCCETSLAVPRDVNLDGRHDLLQGKGSDGVTAVIRNNNTAVICTPPGSASLAAKICSPGSNGTVAKTFTVKGSGNAPAGVQRLELWVDGHKKAQALDDQLKASVMVAAGTHKVTVVAVSQFGSTANKSIFVHAQ